MRLSLDPMHSPPPLDVCLERLGRCLQRLLLRLDLPATVGGAVVRKGHFDYGHGEMPERGIAPSSDLQVSL